MADLWCSLVEALLVDLVKFIVTDIFCLLSVFCNPGSQLSPCFTNIYIFALAAWNFVHHSSLFLLFIAIINTFRSLFKASDTFNVFQVLIKMADSHQHLNRLFH